MKFIPRILKENINISKTPPLRELLVLLSGILGCLLIIYIALGFALDILVEKTPPKLEQAIGDFFGKKYKLEKPLLPAEAKMQKLLDELARHIPEKNYMFTVHIVDRPHVNAVALPGGNIVVYSGLLKETESENELAMVLAHELGHFAHKDHLRGLGRRLVLVLISSVLFGTDSSVTEFVMRTLVTADLRFSRQQEVAADKFALELMYKKYGHVAGTTDFFERTKDKKKIPRFLEFFSTHPFHYDRHELLKEEIRKKGYLIKDKIPLDPIYRDYKEK